MLALERRQGVALIKALARAFRYQHLLDEGRYASISEMAEGEKIERGYLGTLLQLTILAPSIVEAFLDGQRLDGLSLQCILGRLPNIWADQHTTIISG